MASEDRQPETRAPFAAEPDPTPPALPGQVVLRRDTEALFSILAADLLIHATNCVRTFGDFHLALSGGSTPMPFYRRLMVDPAYRSFPWERTHLWIVDERRVPVTDERSNYRAIAEYIVDHTDIPMQQAHPIAATEPDADVRYERELKETLAWREKGHDRLDYILLGMGADAHTASLFPRSPALSERERFVRINEGPTVTPPDRVTMTFPLINASRFIAILVTGEGKRETIGRVARGAEPIEDLPVRGVMPVGRDDGTGTLRWYLDHAACPGR
jgi:6-phosphogluconolactonase